MKRLTRGQQLGYDIYRDHLSVLTPNQLLHRQYLQSPVWQAKRLEALTHYGCICNRCKRHGTDVHHKTYERVGGGELMDDLEVLCRPCHNAHHRVEKAVQPKSRHKTKKRLHAKGAIGYLTSAQKTTLIQHFSFLGEISLNQAIYRGDNRVLAAVARVLGVQEIYGTEMDKARHLERIDEDKKEKRRLNKLARRRAEQGLAPTPVPNT